MTAKTRAFDAAATLETEEDIAAYLSEALASVLRILQALGLRLTAGPAGRAA